MFACPGPSSWRLNSRANSARFPKSFRTSCWRIGPTLGRPMVDTLKGSKHSNLKKLRFDADNGVWRTAFAFDPRRHGVLLAAGDKSGTSEKRFYRGLIATADSRLDAHLERLKRKTEASAPKRKK